MKKKYASTLERVKAYQVRHRERVLARARERYAANRDALNAKTQAWRDANREKYREMSRASYRRHKEKAQARSREWKEKNKERNSATEHEYRQKNRERTLETYRSYKKRHPEKVLEATSLRRARIHKGKIAKFTAAQLRARLSMFGNRCWMCGEEADQVDHVIPLAKGGAHVLANLRPACGSCNRRKGARRLKGKTHGEKAAHIRGAPGR